MDGKFDDEADGRSPDTSSKAWAIGVGVCCLFPIYILFSVFGNAGRGTAAMCFGGTIIIVVRLRWELRNRMWFWPLVAFVVLLHLAMVLLIPWPNNNYTLPIVLPVGILDALAIGSVIQLVARRTGPVVIADDPPAPR